MIFGVTVRCADYRKRREADGLIEGLNITNSCKT
jgi:hypothetical protein